MKIAWRLIAVLFCGAGLTACKKSTPASEGPKPDSRVVLLGEGEEVVTRVAFGSCYRPNSKHSNIWQAIAKTKPQMFLFMGDNVYADTENMKLMQAKYRQLLEHPGYAKFAKEHKVLAVWDDHDYGKNDAGREYPMKRESQNIFQDAFGFPAEHPARSRDGVYYSYAQGPKGKRVQLIFLDTRYHRSPLIKKKFGKYKRYIPVTDPEATMLGAAQWQWLEQTLQEPADLRIIVSSIQIISSEHYFEKWSNIPAERKRFFELLKQANAGRVVLLSGDRHLAEISKLPKSESGLEHDLVEVTSSGMTHAGAWGLKNKYRVSGSYTGKKNFGSLEIDWATPGTPSVVLKIHYHDGLIFKQLGVEFK